ncbi:hypothetical protein [Micromonospora sp. MH99]|uniref:hypothetical protein n=1 Tax=Micromonospora sp. MH99 TaxID=1945510 RepID=UPI001F464ECF|nr:hypothetical protein [Micromonospora sp. MH99]
MSDPADLVLAYWNEHRQQLRQCENQRATMTNFVLVVTAALSGLIIQQRFAVNATPLGVLIIMIGGFGAVLSAKYHERAVYHLGQARALTDTLRDINALGNDMNIVEHRQSHYRAFPRMYRIRLHALWTGLHIVIALYGLALTLIIAFV